MLPGRQRRPRLGCGGRGVLGVVGGCSEVRGCFPEDLAALAELRVLLAQPGEFCPFTRIQRPGHGVLRPRRDGPITDPQRDRDLGPGPIRTAVQRDRLAPELPPGTSVDDPSGPPSSKASHPRIGCPRKRVKSIGWCRPCPRRTLSVVEGAAARFVRDGATWHIAYRGEQVRLGVRGAVEGKRITRTPARHGVPRRVGRCRCW